MKLINAKSGNCPNCGAKISHSYNHNCEYCGGIIDFNEPDVIEVKAEDLVDVKLRYIEYEPINNNYILIFDGYKCPMPKVYNYDGKCTYLSKVENYTNPPKCGMCIAISDTELKQNGYDYIKYEIYNTGLRKNEVDKVMQQVLENEEIKYLMR